jgi:hypothetical protein
MSTANNNETIMNSGAPKYVEIGFFIKIRKNTMPFQAKLKLRKAFVHKSVLAPGLKNNRYVKNAAATTMAIETGHSASLYSPTRFQNVSVLAIKHLLHFWSFSSCVSTIADRGRESNDSAASGQSWGVNGQGRVVKWRGAGWKNALGRFPERG